MQRKQRKYQTNCKFSSKSSDEAQGARDLKFNELNINWKVDGPSKARSSKIIRSESLIIDWTAYQCDDCQFWWN